MICILLSTYNGEKYLEEQLNSLLKQKKVKIQILVRDDGSTDKTHEILNKWQNKGLLRWYTGINKKPAQSFMDLLHAAPKCDYYAFCDQDDVWLPEKLSVAVNAIKNNEIPALYFGQTQMVDDELNKINTPIIYPKCILEEAVINHCVTGCTVVFNQLLFSLLKQYKPIYISMHDSWCYQVCLAVNGKVFFDSYSQIFYRQHSNNVIGLKTSRYKEWKRRLMKSFLMKEKERSKTARELLQGYNHFLTIENRELLKMLVNYEDNISLWIRLLFSTRVKPMGIKSNIFFRLSVLLKRF